MNKKLLELLNQINEQKIVVQNLVEEGNLEGAQAAKNTLIELQNKFDLLSDVLDAEPVPNNVVPVPAAVPVDSVAEFANAARQGFRNAGMTEGTPADGGYTVPEDIQTRINEYREAQASLISCRCGECNYKQRTAHV